MNPLDANLFNVNTQMYKNIQNNVQKPVSSLNITPSVPLQIQPMNNNHQNNLTSLMQTPINRTDIKPGHIINVLQNSEIAHSGAVVKNDPNALVYFKVLDGEHPVFSKVDSNVPVEKVGHINQDDHKILKNALLKYYWKNNDNKSQKDILTPLLNFAFVDGVPKLVNDQGISQINELLKHNNFSRVNKGNRIKLYCDDKSTLSFLNNSTVDVVDTFKRGIRVLRTGQNFGENKYFTMFYKDPNVYNKFAGVKAVEMIDEYYDLYKDDLYQKQIESVNSHSALDDCPTVPTELKYDNQIYLVNPSSLTVKGVHNNATGVYDIDNDQVKIVISDENAANVIPEQVGGAKKIKDEESDSDDEIPTPKSSKTKIVIVEEEVKVDEDEEVDEVNEVKDDEVKVDEEDEVKVEEDEEVKDDEEEITKTPSELTDTLDEELDIVDFDDLDIQAIPIEIGKEVFYKVKRVPVPDEKKEYRESLQRAEIFKILIENIPKISRNTNIIRKINKVTNRIINLKNKYTHPEDKKVMLIGDDYRPFANDYIKNDYSNKFLIPIVLDKKKIYLDEDTDVNLYDDKTNLFIRDQIEEINEINQVVISIDYKNQLVNFDSLERNLINKTEPYIYNDIDVFISDDINRIADGIVKELLPFKSYDTMVFRTCVNKYICNSYGHNKLNVDFNTLLGPFYRFTKKEESSDKPEDEDLNKSDDITTKLGSFFREITPGQRMNIVGYVSLPYEFDMYMSHRSPDRADIAAPKKILLLSELYNKYLVAGRVEYKYVDDKLDTNDVLKAKHDNKIVYYLFKGDKKWSKIDYLNKLIPTITDILEHDNKSLEHLHNINHIKNYIGKYGYDFDESLVYNELKYLMKHVQKNNKKYIEYYSDLYHEFDKNKSIYNRQLISKQQHQIDDDIIQELEKYYGIYGDHNKPIDTDLLRLKWMKNNVDHGVLGILMMLKRRLANIDFNDIISKLKSQLADINSNRMELKDKITSDTNVHKYFSKSMEIKMPNGKHKCLTKLDNDEEIEVAITYNSLDELELDNFRKIKGESGEIEVNQFASVGEDIYRRTVNDTGEFWKLYKSKILNEQKCQGSSINLTNGCEMIENVCLPRRIVRMYKKYKSTVDEMNNLLRGIKMWRNYPKMMKSLNTDIEFNKTKLKLRQNRTEYLQQNKMEELRRIEEEVKKFKPDVKDCIHFQATNYVNGLPNITYSQKYSLIDSILQKFMLIENEDIRIDVVHENPEDNWSHCNICKQRLYCNHFLYALNNVTDAEGINLSKLKDIFGEENEGAYYCHMCGEIITTTEALSVEKFVKVFGKGTQRMIAHAVLEEENDNLEMDIIDTFWEKIDNMNNMLVKSDMKYFMNTLQQILDLCGISLSTEHESEMINYIQSSPFVSREFIMEQFKKTGKIENTRQLQYLTEKQYKKNCLFDIAARLFFILQTSEITYNIYNVECVGRLDGYPMVDDENLNGGIKFMACIIDKMKHGAEWKLLETEANLDKVLFNRVKKGYEDDEYIRNKYKNYVQNKGAFIVISDLFRKHPTNAWNQFLPDLVTFNVDWKPKLEYTKTLYQDITSSNINNFINVSANNNTWICSKYVELLNEKISKSEPVYRLNLQPLWNSCCIDTLTKDYSYYQSYKHTPEFDKYLQKTHEIEDIENAVLASVSTTSFAINYSNTPTKTKQDNKDKDNDKIGGGERPFEIGYYHFNGESYDVDDNLSDQIKRNLLINFVAIGVYAGQRRTYNEYDICILTGETKQSIMEHVLSDDEAKVLLQAIRNKQDVPMLVDICPDFTANNNIKARLTKFIENNSELKTDNFLIKFLSGLFRSWDSRANQQTLLQHWIILNNQISAEIDHIVENLSFLNIPKSFRETVEHIGLYRRIYKERLDKTNRNIANREKLKLREANIKKYLTTYIRNSMARVKNQSFDVIESMGESWHFLMNYKNYGNLFIKMFRRFNNHIIGIEEIYGTANTVFSPDESASLLHYIMVKALADLFGIHQEKIEDIKLTTGSAQSSHMVELSEVQESLNSVSIDHSDTVDTTGSQSSQFIKNIHFKQTEEGKIVAQFIYNIILKIDEDEKLYDSLTQDNIHRIVEQERRKSLKHHLKLFQVMEEAGKREEKIIAQALIQINAKRRMQLEKMYGLYTGNDDVETTGQTGIDQHQDQHQIDDQVREQQLQIESVREEIGYVAGEADDIDDFDM